MFVSLLDKQDWSINWFSNLHYPDASNISAFFVYYQDYYFLSSLDTMFIQQGILLKVIKCNLSTVYVYPIYFLCLKLYSKKSFSNSSVS